MTATEKKSKFTIDNIIVNAVDMEDSEIVTLLTDSIVENENLCKTNYFKLSN